MRIIDKDIEMYTASVEKHTRDLLRCMTFEEPRHDALREAAQRVLDALQAYRAVLDQPQER